MEEKLRNLTYITVLGFIILGLLIIGLYFKDGKTTTTNPTTNTGGNTTTEYDVSKMNKVDIKGALALFKDKGTHVLYIGRSTCSVCVNTVPVLNQVQAELNYKTNYLEVEVSKSKPWTDWQKELKELTDKFNIETKVNSEEGTIGELFYDHGYTPTTVIIKNGKVVDGFIGYRNKDVVKELVKKYL